jgi:hypothetical protein
MDIETALIRIETEYLKASDKFPKFASSHEGYAVLLEEVSGLWEAIKGKPQEPLMIRVEAIQVAAMAIRFLVDCC